MRSWAEVCGQKDNCLSRRQRDKRCLSFSMGVLKKSHVRTCRRQLCERQGGRKETSPDTNSGSTLILNFCPPVTVRK